MFAIYTPHKNLENRESRPQESDEMVLAMLRIFPLSKAKSEVGRSRKDFGSSEATRISIFTRLHCDYSDPFFGLSGRSLARASVSGGAHAQFASPRKHLRGGTREVCRKKSEKNWKRSERENAPQRVWRKRSSYRKLRVYQGRDDMDAARC